MLVGLLMWNKSYHGKQVKWTSWNYSYLTLIINDKQYHILRDFSKINIIIKGDIIISFISSHSSSPAWPTEKLRWLTLKFNKLSSGNSESREYARLLEQIVWFLVVGYAATKLFNISFSITLRESNKYSLVHEKDQYTITSSPSHSNYITFCQNVMHRDLDKFQHFHEHHA